MTKASEFLAVAVKEIGYKEGKNNDTKYGIWYGMNHQPWCDMFVGWCGEKSKTPVTVVPHQSYVPYTYEFYKKKGRWHNKSGYTPKPGDLIIFGQNDHIGIVEKVANGSVVTIEGNTSANGNSSNGDGVYRRTRTLNNSWIKGYCSPEWEDEMEKKKIEVKSLDSGGLVIVEGYYGDGTNAITFRELPKLFPEYEVGWDGKYPTVKRKQ